jgi:hypothetical protein
MPPLFDLNQPTLKISAHQMAVDALNARI